MGKKKIFIPGEKVTESPSLYRHLEKMPVAEILSNINKEDQTIAIAVEKAIPAIESLVNVITGKILSGGRLVYIGAGTSGRLGILDASECTVTFGIPKGLITGIIAGGDKAITEPVEFAEDDVLQGWKDLEQQNVNHNDLVIGIAASGTTPYVVNALKQCKANNIVTGSISCNPGALISNVADFPVEVIVGPEFITGSTRMKAGTAQKLVLNMLSTAVMIQLGKVEDNRMVNMQLTNEKLLERGTKMIMETLLIDNIEEARTLLLKHGSVKKAILTNRL